MATIGFRWEGHEPPPDKDEWERVVSEALAERSFTGTVVLTHADGMWEIEAARVGQFPATMQPPPFPDPMDVQPEVEKALLQAGKPVRARAVAPAR
ncbi:MAG TPA: hypothetical protein VFO85_20765 [Vicinamibacteria bacterium]|nr:hypothetical protein [Vicinamibacteria bacterium]